LALRELWGVGCAQPAREERFEPENGSNWVRLGVGIRQGKEKSFIVDKVM